MPRRTADARHRIDPDATHDLMDLLVALYHPTRRWQVERCGWRVRRPSAVWQLAPDSPSAALWFATRRAIAGLT